LEHLEKSNLFLVPLDEERTWFRYHHLFRDFLQSRINKTQSQEVNRLHRAACEWLAEHGFLREAAEHAFQTQDWEYAAAFVDQHSFTLIVHGEIATLYEWCSAFPEEVMRRHPMLCLLQSLALAYSFRRQNEARVKARLQQAEQLIALLDDRQAARGLLDMAAVVRTFLAMAPDPAADPRELLALAQSMLSAYPEGDPSRFSGLLLTGYAYLALHEAQAAEQAFETAKPIAQRERMYFGVVEATFHLAQLAHSQGNLRRAAEICRQGQADIASMLSIPEEELPAMGSLEVAQGSVLLELDQLDEAEEYLRHGLDLMGGGMNPYYLMTAYVALFRLYEAQGRTAEALKNLDRLEAAWPDMAFYTNGLRTMHRLRSQPGDPTRLAEAAAWARDISPLFDQAVFSPGLGPIGSAEVYYLASLEWVRACITIGNPRSTRRYLERQLELAAKHGLSQRAIELSLLDTLVSQSDGDSKRAMDSLELALRLAEPEGYLRIFDQGPDMIRLLVEAARHDIFQAYIERILAAIGATKTVPSKQEDAAISSIRTPFGESLSERELEVLRLIAQGASNREIAERLVITVGTVKSHVNHILGKLDSHNRTEAVAQARKLGLL
jgi:LuxR family maltose regulon positive regulatory protein